MKQKEGGPPGCKHKNEGQLSGKEVEKRDKKGLEDAREREGGKKKRNEGGQGVTGTQSKKINYIFSFLPPLSRLLFFLPLAWGLLHTAQSFLPLVFPLTLAFLTSFFPSHHTLLLSS